MRSVRILVLAVTAVIVVAAPAYAAPVTLTANMTGDDEAPQKGPAGATGSATLDVNRENNQLCYTFVTQNLNDPLTGGHIHKGAKGVAGDVLIDLKVTAGNLKGCVTGEPAKIQALLGDVQGYYVNLHTQANPAGAVRGQLMAAITNPQAAVPESQSAAPAIARTGPGSAGLLVAIAFGLLSAGTAVRLGSRRR
jgi:CHRD domain-containing protein